MNTGCEHGLAKLDYFRMFPSVPGTAFDVEGLRSIARTRYRAGSTSGIPAGYTYLGQFVGHDLTFMSQTTDEPGRGPIEATQITNLVSPTLDLDGLYGNPGVVPMNGALLLSNRMGNGSGRNRLIVDVPRRGRPGDLEADIGDPRNDQNMMLSQLHVLFMNLHNRMAVDMRARRATDLAAVRRQVTLIYQLVVVRDYLRRLLHPEVYAYLFPPQWSAMPKNKGILQPTPGTRARIPIEFSAAAFRFGHSIIRRRYRVSADRTLSIDELLQRSQRREPAYAVDWKYQLDMRAYGGPAPQQSMPIDFAFEVPELPTRNLERGLEVDLPDAQALLQAIRAVPKYRTLVSQSKINTGPAGYPFHQVMVDWQYDQLTPLWLYIVLEAQATQQLGKQTLGVLGSVIVGETIRAVLASSRDSIYHLSEQELAELAFFGAYAATVPNPRPDLNPHNVELGDVAAYATQKIS